MHAIFAAINSAGGGYGQYIQMHFNLMMMLVACNAFTHFHPAFHPALFWNNLLVLKQAFADKTIISPPDLPIFMESTLYWPCDNIKRLY